MDGFDSLESAKMHEMDSDGARKRRRPGSPANFSDDPISASFDRTPHQQYTRQRHFPFSTPDPSPLPIEKAFGDGRPHPSQKSMFPMLLISPVSTGPSNLSDLDTIICRNVEIFQATSEDVADHEMSSSAGQTRISSEQIGIRCIHCINASSTSDMSTIYPPSVSSICASLRSMAEIHFSQCRRIPPHIRSDMMRAEELAESRRRNASQGNLDGEEDEWNRIALVDFCVDFCRKKNIVNCYPAQTGIMYDSSQGGHKSRSSPDAFHGASALMQPTPVAPKRRNKHEKKFSSSKAKKTAISPLQFQTPQSQQSEDHQNSPKSRLSQRETPRMDMFPQYPEQSQQQSNQASTYGSQVQPQGPHGPLHPSAFEAPGSTNYPFFQDGYGNWVCRYCTSVPYAFRAPNSVWQSQQPPHPMFIEQHLSQCRGGHNAQPGTSSQASHPYQTHAQQNFPPPTSSYGPPPMSWSGVPQGHHHPQHHANYQHAMQTSPHLMSQMGGPPPPHYPPHPDQRGPPHPHGQGYHYQQPPFLTPYGHLGSGPPPTESMQRQPPRSMHINEAANRESSSSEVNEAAISAAIEYLQNADKEYQKAMTHSVEGNTELVLKEDKLLLTDYFYYIMKQLKICRFSESDRKTRGGKRENVAVGYGGLQCIHCAESPNSRKFFWSNVDRLANSFAEIPGHVLKCRRCPNQTKISLQELKRKHPDQMSVLPRGSQKVFFRRMWRRLHDEDPDDKASDNTVKVKKEEPEKGGVSQVLSNSETSTTSDMLHTPVAKRGRSDPPYKPSPGSFTVGMTTEAAAKALANSSTNPPESTKSRILLALDEDKEWLSDMDCFVRRNIEVFCATKNDVEIAKSDRKYPINLTQIGIRCIHCASSDEGEGARGTAVSFPYSISGIYESVREFQRLHLETCPCLPDEVREGLEKMKGSTSLSSVLRRYYVLAAKALGMHDTADGIRASGESLPIGPSATYDFASSGTPSGSSEKMRSSSSGSVALSFLRPGPTVTPLESRKRKSRSESPDRVK